MEPGKFSLIRKSFSFNMFTLGFIFVMMINPLTTTGPRAILPTKWFLFQASAKQKDTFTECVLRNSSSCSKLIKATSTIRNKISVVGEHESNTGSILLGTIQNGNTWNWNLRFFPFYDFRKFIYDIRRCVMEPEHIAIANERDPAKYYCVRYVCAKFTVFSENI